MSDIFSSSRSSIRVAKKSLKHIKQISVKFVHRKPYEQIEERNPDGPGKIHKIRMKRQLPSALTDWTVTCVNSLRAALDQAGYATAIAANTRAKDTYFPFGDTENYVLKLNTGSCKDLPPDIFSLFCSFKPYPGGNDLLWCLNKLCNAQKHRIIVPVGIAVDSIEGPLEVGGGYFKVFEPPVWDSEKDEMIIAILGDETKLKYKLHIRFFIAFGDVGLLKGHQVGRVLDELVSKVSSIVDATEAESRRIGLIS